MDPLMWLAAAALLVLAVPLCVTFVIEFFERRKYRHIPGPPGAWYFGSLKDFIKHGMNKVMVTWAEQYGPLVQFRLGARHFVAVLDPDAARSVLFKCVNHAPLSNPNMNLMTHDLRKFDDMGLLLAMDDHWRTLRTAWQPAFSSATLDSYCGLMHGVAVQLVRSLEGAAASGQAVDLHQGLGNMTLAVVGTCAYGVDFRTFDEASPGAAEAGSAVPEQQHWQQQNAAMVPGSAAMGRALVVACQDWFGTMSPSVRSKYAIFTVLTPTLLPLVRRLACWLPDETLARHIRARKTLMQAARSIVRHWQAEHTAGTADAAAAGGRASVATAAAADASVTAAANGLLSPGSAERVPTAPGGFLGLMLAARAKVTGAQLTDEQVIAQAQTFILGGYETTANAIAFAVYCLATHPEAQQRLLEEIDAYGRGRELQAQDLEQLPYANAVVQEALRLYPPAHSTSRLNDKPMQVLGFEVPAGTTLLLPIHYLQHMGNVWPRADEFLPQRHLPEGVAAGLGPSNPSAMLPFGLGTRMCVGWKFALQEARMALVTLYQHYWFELAPGQVPLQVTTGLTQSPKHGLLVRVHQR